MARSPALIAAAVRADPETAGGAARLADVGRRGRRAVSGVSRHTGHRGARVTVRRTAQRTPGVPACRDRATLRDDDAPLPDLPPLPADPRWRVAHLPFLTAVSVR